MELDAVRVVQVIDSLIDLEDLRQYLEAEQAGRESASWEVRHFRAVEGSRTATLKAAVTLRDEIKSRVRTAVGCECIA